MDRISLDVFDYSGRKLTNLYDSACPSAGDANELKIEWEMAGQRTLTFNLPYRIDEAQNWRWDYIQSEYKARVLVNDDYEDWFIITNPKKQKGSKRIGQEVKCDHLSSILKTKNLYLVLDEKNGIGDAPYLMKTILAGTGWTFDEERSDTFVENHATNATGEVKKRSLQSDGKEGAYSLIGKVCDLFNAYPIFDAVHKSVALYDLNNKKPMHEMIVGVNLTGMTAEYDSTAIVTRLYVEGDYDDNGKYVGIEDVNPYGLNYLMDFSYYKQIGAFTDEHQAALDKYYADIRRLRESTYSESKNYTKAMSELTSLWGTQSYVLWTVTDGVAGGMITGGSLGVKETDKLIDVGDKIYVFYHNDSNADNKDRYLIKEVDVNTSFEFDYDHYPEIGEGGVVTHVLKWVTGCSGSIGAKEAKIESKEQLIKEYRDENNAEHTSDAKRKRNNELIAAQMADIEQVYLGNYAADPQTYDYTVKITGVQSLKVKDAEGNPYALECEMVRTAINSIINTTTYFLDDYTADVKTDDTVSVLQSGSKIRFGEYGLSQAIAGDGSVQGLNFKLTGLTKDIMNITTAPTDFRMTVLAEDDIVDAFRMNGTTFTITIKAKPYSLYDQYAMALQLAKEVDRAKNSYNQYMAEQKSIEADFAIAMGDMLRDGYWTNDNYIVGQEQYLYNDALDVMAQVCKPQVKYSVSLLSFAMMTGMSLENIDLNTKIRIYDPQLNINDTVYVSKITKVLDMPNKSQVEISNEQVQIGNSFDSIFSRVNDISRLVEQKKTVFERAQALTANGSLAADRLEGAINTMTTQLGAAVSSWYTDDDGNIMFESADGQSAMKLCGDGWMIANGKNDDGTWQWRTAATGKGLVADMITTGYLSADRIEAESITANKLASDVGQSLDLSSNKSISLNVQDVINGKVGYVVKITSEDGFFIQEGQDTVTLKANVFNDGVDITGSAVAFNHVKWYIDGKVYNPGAMIASTETITLDANIIKESVPVRCVYTTSGTDDITGLPTEAVEYWDEVYVTNTISSNHITIRLYCDTQDYQVFDPNQGIYMPDWEQDVVTIVPTVYYDHKEIDVESTDNMMGIWNRIVDGKHSVMDNTMEHVDPATDVLRIDKNVMKELGVEEVTYRFSVIKAYGSVSEQVTFRLVAAEEKPKLCRISGNNMFTQTDKIWNPTAIILSCDVQNVNFVRWECLQSDGSWQTLTARSDGTVQFYPGTKYDGSDNAYAPIIVRAVTDDEYVYDQFVIHRVSNTNSDDSYQYHAYIRYSAYENGREMTASPTSDSKYIGIYAGPSDVVPSREEFSWSKYGVSNSTQILLKSSKIEYAQVHASNTGMPLESQWKETVPAELYLNYWLWVRFTLVFDNGTDEGFTIQDYTTSKITSNMMPQHRLFVRYSAQGDGSNMSINPNLDTRFIGTYIGTSTSAPTNYTAYKWMMLVDDNGVVGGEKNIVSTMFRYNWDTSGTMPSETSKGWITYLPTMASSRYIFVKATATYDDGTTTTSYHKQWCGNNGTNHTEFAMQKKHINISANYEGKCYSMQTVCYLKAYNGVQKVAPVIDPNLLTYWRDGEAVPKPTGMNVAVGSINNDDQSNYYGDLAINISVAQNANLGSYGQTYGEIHIPASVMNNGVRKEYEYVISWCKVNKTYSGTDGKNYLLLDVTSDELNIFKANGNITMRAAAYYGATDISTVAEFKWYKFSNGAWVDFHNDVDYVGHSSVSATRSDILTSDLFKCDMRYMDNVVTDLYAVHDDKDYQNGYIESSGGTMINRQSGNIDLMYVFFRSFNPSKPPDNIPYTWYRISRNGEIYTLPGNGINTSVSLESVGSESWFICNGYYQGLTRIITTGSGVITSDKAPANPKPGDIWMDTSGPQAVTKRYVDAYETEDGIVPAGWVTISTDRDSLLESFIERTADLYVTQEQLGGYVSEKQYNDKIGELTEQIGNMALTPHEFKLMFTNTVESDILQKVQTKYLVYDGETNTLRLGSEGDEKQPFQAHLTQDKLAFIYKDPKNFDKPSQVAYIGKDDMYITNARVTEKLFLGRIEDGYFVWTVTPKGLGLKYVGKNA